MASPYTPNLNLPTPTVFSSPFANSYETPVRTFQQVLQVSANSVRSINSFMRGTGTITATGKLSLISGTTAQSLSAFESQQYVYSATGAIQVIKFSALFNTGVAGTLQLAGYGNSAEGYFFGYNGASFGILLRCAGAPQVVSITVTTGTGTVAGTLTITLNGVATNIVVPANTGVYALVALIMGTSFATAGAGSGWSLNQLGTTITFTAMTSGVRNGTYSYAKGVTTMVLTIATSITGVAPTDLWVPQANWSYDTVDGTQDLPVLDPTVGNIYQISIETLSFGTVTFYIVDPVTGRYVPVHQHSLRAVLPMTQESCPFRASVENNATTSSLKLTVPDVAATIYGSTEIVQCPPFSTATNVYPTITSNTVMHLMSIKNNVVVNGLLNKSTVRLTSVTLGTNSTYCLYFPIVKNSSYTGVPAAGFVWSVGDTDSVTSVLKVNTFNLTGGQPLATLSLGASGQIQVDLMPYYIHLEPGDELNIGVASAQPGASAIAVLSASISWIETR